MANEKKSIIEEALLEAQKIDATFKSNAKEILAHTMSSEIEEMVKESLTGSRKRLKEDEEEKETDLEFDAEKAEGEEGEEEMDLDLDLDTEEGEEGEEEEMDLDLDLDTEEGEEEEEEMDLDLDLGDESEEEEEEIDFDDLTGGEPMGGEEELETVDLTGHNDADVISVFKKMGPEDEIEVVNDNGMVTLKDNKSGSEYRIELNQAGDVSNVEMGDMDMELGEGKTGSNEVIYEIVIDDENEDYMWDVDHMSSYMSYDDSDLDNPEKADLNHDHDTPYEKKRGMAIEKNMKTDHMDYMNHMDHMDYMEDENEDHMDYMKDEDEDHMDYMSRTKSSVGRYRTGNRTNPNAMKRMGNPMMGESKTSQSIKLIKENTNLNTKNASLVSENQELKENQEKMVDALKQFRKKLQEVAVFNSNLTYAVRLFTENTTTKEEKQEILKRLDSAKNLKESQSIYKQLVKEYTNGKSPIKETIEEKINKTASSGSAQISEQSVFIHPELKNMKKLWEYSYKK